MEECKIGLCAPWTTYYRQLEALFKEDPEVRVAIDYDKSEIKLFVENAEKADAITQLLPTEKTWGSVTLKITVVPANVLNASHDALVAKAFEGNPAVSFVHKTTGVFTNDITYVVFKPWIVQFFNDDLGDIHGCCTTLYQDIAKNVFGELNGVFFCTDTPQDENGKKVGMPLGEWP